MILTYLFYTNAANKANEAIEPLSVKACLVWMLICFFNETSVVYNLGVLKHFEHKKSDEKIYKTHKDFKRYQVFMYNSQWKLS